MNEKFGKFLDGMRGARVAVIGMGVSNTPLIRLLLREGAEVVICDKKEREFHDAALLAEFEGGGASIKLGADYLSGLDATLIFKTPGMRYDVPELISAEERGAVITTEMEQFLAVCPCRTIGITGSDGKTTTTTIIGKLLERSGRRCYVGGNIGTPLLSLAGEMSEDDFAIVELSSFQLMNIKKSPNISVITNIAPNHLDVHRSMDEYIEAKKQIYRFSNGAVILNADNAITKSLSEELPKRAVLFSSADSLNDGFCIENGSIVKRTGGKSEEILSVSEIKIPGMHNVENYMAAIAATDGLVSHDDIRDVARTFGGVPHRMELVRELDGVRYYNDSIASSPTRTIAGLRAFNRRVILIAGGYDKNIPFDVLGDAAQKYVKKLVLVGATAEKIEKAVLGAAGYDSDKLPVFRCATFEEAVEHARRISESGDIVTLSPASASFDMFKNFEERGNRFKELVNALSAD